MSTKHTPGPWVAEQQFHAKTKVSLGWIVNFDGGRIGWSSYATSSPNEGEGAPHEIGGANARLIAAAPTMLDEMVRFLEVIERAEADPGLWSRLTAGTGIATANAYRAAIAKATGESA